MANTFRAFLVNDLFGDPALYVGLPWERRALLFDLGDIRTLSAGQLLKISDVFVSHAHIDHVIGFDQLLRVLLGRRKPLRLYGPPGFIGNVEGRLRGYTWNLVDAYTFSLEVREVHPDRIRCARFACREGFRRVDGPDSPALDGVLITEPEFRVRCACLDHRIPCLAFALEEPVHLNVDKARLDELDLPVGPWLMDVKRAIRAGKPDDYPIRAAWSDADRRHERWCELGVLRREVMRESPGEKLVYVTDALDSAANRERILALADGADVFFCEAGYPERDAARAQARYHLTAAQAGRLAAAAGARHFAVFHLSPKYRECAADLVAEAMAAFAETRDRPGTGLPERKLDGRNTPQTSEIARREKR